MSDEAHRVLFIGNSFTSRNNGPGLIEALAARASWPLELVTASIVAGGASLRRHWNAGVAQRTLASGPWDDVVLQEQSTLPIKSPERYHANVRLFVPEIRKRGAQPVLYLTWSRQGVPEHQALLDAAVDAIADETGARVVPVGRIWHAVRTRHPDIALYDKDGSHPSPIGSYLAACTFLVGLLGRAPSGTAVADRLGIDHGTAERLHTIVSSVAAYPG